MYVLYILIINTSIHCLPDGCKTNASGGCFWTEMIAVLKTNFTRAEERCKLFSSILAVIPDNKTFNAIVANVQKKLTNEWSQRYWLGMTYNVS